MNRSISLLLCSLILFVSNSALLAEDWPQWRGPNRNGVWRETGLIEKFDSDQLKIRWRVPISAGYSGPTVANGRVFVTDRIVKPAEAERIHCFDSKTGRKLWTHQYACRYGAIGYKAGPRAGVTIEGDRAFALGAAGHLHCLDVKVGDVVWKKDLSAQYKIDMPIWGIAGAPLIVDDYVIIQVGAKDACMVAFDKKTGDEVWRALSDRAQYSSPILIEQANHRVLVCWTGDSVAGLDPLSGKVHWRVPFAPKNMPIGIATPVWDGNRLFFTSFYDGSLMLELSQERLEVEKLWHRVGRDEKNTDALHSIISTPLILDDHIYGVDSYGELRCLAAKNGDRLWEDLTATPKIRWGTIHFVRNRDKIWMFNDRGELIIAKLSPRGFQEISRAKLIRPTRKQLNRRDGVCWAHPAFANKHVFVRNDEELVCASLEAQ